MIKLDGIRIGLYGFQYPVPGIQFQPCRIQGYRDTEIQEYRNTGIQGYKDRGIQGYRNTGIQEYRLYRCRDTGVHG